LATVSSIERLEQRASEAEERAERLRKIALLAQEVGEEGLAELVELFGSDRQGVDDHASNGNGNGHETPKKGPRGREAVRLIVKERDGLWTLAQIIEEMQHREWFTSRKGVEVAVARMIADGEGRRERKGVYEFPAPPRETVILP
jgi:hypothetical protein